MASDAHIWDLTNILRRRSRLVLVTAVIGTTLIGIGPQLIPPQYTAKSQVLIEPQGLIAGQASVVEQPADEAAVLTEMTALTSHDLLQRALDNLSQDRGFRAAVSKPSRASESILDDLRHRLTGWIPRSWLTATGEPGPLNLRQLKRHLQVYQETGSHVISVSVTSSSPDEAAAVANRITQLYVEGQEQQKRASTDRTLAWLSERIPKLNNDVRSLEAQVRDYRAAHNLGGSNPAAVADQQLDNLNHQLTAAESDLTTRQARLEKVRSLRSKGAGANALVGYLDSPALTEMRRQELGLLQAQAAQGVAFVESSPRMRQIRGELDEVRRQINQEVDRAVAGLDNEAQIAAAQVQSIKRRLTTVEGASSDVRLNELERSLGISRHLYETLLQRQEELHEQRESLSTGVRLLSLAPVPDRPSSLNPVLFIPPALIVSLMLGCFLAVIKEQLDQTLRSEREVSDALGIPCIGFVPQLQRIPGRSRPHHQLVNRPFSAYSEAIRSIVAALQLASPQRSPKVILISSSLPGEGKTTLAVSFATYAAMLGRRVVLVDLDFRRPSIMRELGGKAERGLLDLLLHGRPSTEVIQRAPGLPLDYLPVAHGHSVDPLRLFAHEHMSLLLRRLKEKYDCVVIDSAPLLAITEARLLASMVDKVVFVVKWGRTRRETAQNALGLIRNTGLVGRDGSDLAGVVVTQVDVKKHARYNYGDTGEFFAKYYKYYSEETTPRQ